MTVQVLSWVHFQRMLTLKEKQLPKYLYLSQFNKYMASLCAVNLAGEVVYFCLSRNLDPNACLSPE